MATSARRVHYGWIVAATTFVTLLTVAGVVGTAGVLIKPLENEFGWSKAEISTSLSIRFALFGLMAPFAAALFNRYGLRSVTLPALALIGGGLVLSLGMSNLWQLNLLWGVLVGVGTGLVAMVLGATVATRWFTTHRGLVVGGLTASTAAGQLVFLPMMAWLEGVFGWRLALLSLVVLLAVAAVAVALLLRDRPADVGLPPYGEKQVQSAPPPPKGSIVGSAFAALRDASKSGVFWVLFATFFICGLSTNGLIQMHFVPLCADFGMPAVGAASVLAFMGIFNLFGTIASGWLSDRYDNRWLLFWYYGLRGLSLLYLPSSEFTFYGLALFAIFYGLDWIATVPPTVRLTADRFGPERANLVFGWIFAGHQIGAAVAAFAGGYSRTALETYMPAFYAAGVLCLAASVLILTLSRKAPEAVNPQSA